MRLLVLVFAASSLALAGCGEKPATGDTSALDEAVSAEDFATNDATAIDAATGADANMAADVAFNGILNAEEDGEPPASSTARRNRPAAGNNDNGSSNASEPAPAPAPEPIEPAPLSNAG